MKNILYLTFYFEPDLCAGSFRNTPLAYELARQLKGTGKVHVITTLPNRYKSFVTECEQFEKHDNVEITRIKLPGHKSGFIDQVNSFKSFYRQAKKISEKHDYDLVFASSSRLFTAYLGYEIASKKNIPLYLDIRDIFTDTLQDVLKNKILKISLLPFLRHIEKKVFKYATHINLISAGFSKYFEKFHVQQTSFFTNGIDDEFVLEPTDEGYYIENNKPYIITYAGNIGEGQGLHKIVPEMAKLLGPDYRFRIIGDGGAIAKLREALSSGAINNVFLEVPVKRNELIEIYIKVSFYFHSSE
jgi:UDP-N-acetylglucosamine:LPS N-acetylglucosamine transferase